MWKTAARPVVWPGLNSEQPTSTSTICNTSSQKEKQQSEEQKEVVQGEHKAHSARTDQMDDGWVVIGWAGDGRWAGGDGRWAGGDGRWAGGDGRWVGGDGRWAVHINKRK